MSLLKVKVITQIALNIQSLAIRLTGIFIRIVPFKAFFLNGLGILSGMFLMILRIGHWGELYGSHGILEIISRLSYSS